MITKTWKERILELERKVEILKYNEQDRQCAKGRHLPGEIFYYSDGRPWVRCPHCYANLSNPQEAKGK